MNASTLLRGFYVALAFTTLASPGRCDFFVVKPPQSLNQAIQAALQNGDADDVILVQPGEIEEKVTVDYSGSNQNALSIVKMEKNRPVITGGLSIKNARKLLVDGFRVHSEIDDGIAAITVADSAAVQIVDCRGKAQDDGGLDATNSFEIVVDRCVFSAMGTYDPNEIGYGIRIRGLCGHLVRNCEIGGNTYRGIWIEAEASEVRNCEVKNNGHAAGSAGVYIRGLQNLVKSCEIRGTEGVGLIAAGDCKIKKNLVRNNTRAGIRYGEDASLGLFMGGEIIDNVVRDNGEEGILVKASQSGTTVHENTVCDNEEAGVRIAGSGCSVCKNDVRDTKSGSGSGHAVLIESNGNLLNENRFQDNSGDAIHVEGSNNYLFENESKSGKGGFVLSKGTGNTGRDNQTKGKNDFP